MKTQEVEQLAEKYTNDGIYLTEQEKQQTEIAYMTGYNQCQQDMADEWFEYPKNTPPVHSENYLVFVDGYIEIDLFRGDHNKFNSELYNKNCTITHWKTLPNKPLNKQG